MKKVSLLVFLLSIFLLGVNKVYAIDEYAITINSNGTTELRDGKQGTEASTITNNGVYTFENDVLTLNENYHYLFIKVGRSITVTSNNKKTYMNVLWSSESSGVTVTFDNLLSESYETESTTAWIYTSQYAILSHICANNIIIRNSNIKLSHGYSNEDGYIHTKSNSNNEGTFLIENSSVYASFGLNLKKGITIRNSRITTRQIKDDSEYTGDIIIENSYLEDITAEDDYYMQEAIASRYSNLSIKDSTIMGTYSFVGSSVEIDHSIIKPNNDNYVPLNMSNANTFIIKNNSDVELIGSVVAPTFTIRDSKFKNKTIREEFAVQNAGQDYSALSAILSSDFTISNSTIASSSLDVPALMVSNSVNIETDSFVFIDDELRPLEVKKVNLHDYHLDNNPNNYTYSNTFFINQTGYTEGYTLLLNDEPIYSYSSSYLKEYTFKVVNGIWEDGTTDTKTVTLVEATPLTKNLFKTIPLKNNQELTFKQTGDNEYSFIYSDTVNPKTGVISITVLLLLSFVGTIVLTYYRDKVRIFKKI